MHTPLARISLLVLALTVAVPESYAKRTGGGRSVGRQSSAVVQPRPASPPSASRAQPAPAPAQAQRPQPATPPPAARQDLPPNAPERAIPRQASSPWGGLLGGALLGLGLGSLLGDRDRGDDTVNRSEGGSDTGTSASGTGGSEEIKAAGQEEQRGYGSAWWLGILALAVFFLVRRVRRARRH
ncbi:MAG TPA: hypothetical protein VEB70_07065 [Noviherbaspirillum sp.]|nr:hypothetical protein [Noviherbaspirillum sp.]